MHSQLKIFERHTSSGRSGRPPLIPVLDELLSQPTTEFDRAKDLLNNTIIPASEARETEIVTLVQTGVERVHKGDYDENTKDDDLTARGSSARFGCEGAQSFA